MSIEGIVSGFLLCTRASSPMGACREYSRLKVRMSVFECAQGGSTSLNDEELIQRRLLFPAFIHLRERERESVYAHMFDMYGHTCMCILMNVCLYAYEGPKLMSRIILH